ncbi:RidA family protein [Shimazuella sp. AN120528]|uniref:RidA family protein n=1 Tax=Shimazuella soli TaxID=1892854 RepID=UPI001F0DC432|nr:RidA family protein [Shimazuella soli]
MYVGGQNAVNAAGEIVGEDLGTQTEQALRNVSVALAAANATPKDVVKLTIYIVQGHPIQAGFQAARRVEGWDHPAAITVLVVHSLVNPKFLVEIEAIAAVR